MRRILLVTLLLFISVQLFPQPGGFGFGHNLFDRLRRDAESSPTEPFTTYFNNYLQRNDITNGESNYIFDETSNLYPKYYTQAFYCPVPMDSVVTRRNFPNIHKYGSYSFVTYLAGTTHSINALHPHKLEIVRSGNMWKTADTITVKCINDGGTMRAIQPYVDSFFVNQPSMVYADSKLWLMIPTLDLTLNPPVTGSEWDTGKTYITYSEDWGDTWSELIQLDTTTYVPSSKPIVVGNEIWFTGYSIHKTDVSLQHSYLLRYNTSTETVGTKTQLDADWTDLSTTEPVIFEHTDGKYMCIARVNWNAAYGGAEDEHKGSVIAYSDDGLDWSDYRYYDEETSYPNQPHLFKYDDYVYYTRGRSVLHGPVVADTVQWVEKSPGASPWYVIYAYTYRTFYGSASGYIQRYDPRDAYSDQLRNLSADGSIDFCAYDTANDIILATMGMRVSADGGYLGEPWLAIIKPNSVSSSEYTERLVYATEIPGDLDASNTITIYNAWAASDDSIHAEWYDLTGEPTTSITGTAGSNEITFTAGAEVHNAKLIYEIFKPAFVPEFQDVWDAFGTKPVHALANKYDEMVDSLVIHDSIWYDADRFYFTASHDSTDACMDWIHPDSTSYRLVPSAGITWTESVGFVGDGSGHINTQYNPTTDGVHYTRNDAGIFVGSYTNVSEDKYITGVSDGTVYTVLRPRNLSDKAYAIFNSNSPEDIPNTSSKGHLGIRRNAADNVRWVINKEHTDDGNNSTGLPDEDFYALAYNNNGGGALGQATNTLMYLIYSSGLSDAKSNNLADDIEIVLDYNEVGILSEPATYYVDTAGDDSNSGTFNEPFATIQKACEVVSAGEVVHINGGTYTDTSSTSWTYTSGSTAEVFALLYNLQGTVDDTTKIMATPGDTVIWDFSNKSDIGNTKHAFHIDSCEYLLIKDIQVKNLQQAANNSPSNGVFVWESQHIVHDHITAEDMGGHGFMIHGEHWNDPEDENTVVSKYISYINCDANHNQNPLNGYADADGFACNWSTKVDSVYYTNSRANHNSDDGWDLFNSENCHFFFDNCWASGNGYEDDWETTRGDGQGFKWGPQDSTDNSAVHLYTFVNCLAAKNRDAGFDQNTSGVSAIAHMYNNTAIRNAVGFEFYNIASDPVHLVTNNIAYDNSSSDFTDPAGVLTDTYNSWNSQATITSADFDGLDSTELVAVRQADGSLPDISYGELATGSDAIDNGTYVGLSFNGGAPDLGYVESTDTVLLILQSAEVGTYDDSIVVMLFSREPNADSIPDQSAFTLTEDDVEFGIDNISVNLDTLFAALDSTVETGTTILIDYTKPASSTLENLGGFETASWTDSTVTNNSSPYGPELVVDGAMTSTDNWNEATNCSVTGGVLHCVSQPTYSATNPAATIAVESGKTYRVEYTMSNYTGGTFRFSFAGGGTGAGTTHSDNGTYIEELVPTGSDITFELGCRNSALTGDWDNVSVKEVY